jgi:hypothetical protein
MYPCNANRWEQLQKCIDYESNKKSEDARENVSPALLEHLDSMIFTNSQKPKCDACKLPVIDDESDDESGDELCSECNCKMGPCCKPVILSGEPLVCLRCSAYTSNGTVRQQINEFGDDAIVINMSHLSILHGKFQVTPHEELPSDILDMLKSKQDKPFVNASLLQGPGMSLTERGMAQAFFNTYGSHMRDPGFHKKIEEIVEDVKVFTLQPLNLKTSLRRFYGFLPADSDTKNPFVLFVSDTTGPRGIMPLYDGNRLDHVHRLAYMIIPYDSGSVYDADLYDMVVAATSRAQKLIADELRTHYEGDSSDDQDQNVRHTLPQEDGCMSDDFSSDEGNR